MAMSLALRILSTMLFLLGCIALGYFSSQNKQLAADIDRLEAELGKLTISDVNRVYIAEVEKPESHRKLPRILVELAVSMLSACRL